jgi:linoleoyl-CoA desaturase
MTATATKPQSRVTFAKSVGFKKELNRRVDEYFESNQIQPNDNLAMYIKTAIIFSWILGSWAFAVFAPVAIAFKVLACISLGMAIGACGMSVGHDANHGGYSKNSKINYAIGLCYDFIGLSSYLWRFRHNFLHHTYTNITGHDVEIHGDGLVRMAPTMERQWYHQYQHIFIWFVYLVIPFYWSYSDVALILTKGKYYDYKIPMPRTLDMAFLFGLKALGIGFFLGLPIALGCNPWLAIAGYTIAYMTYGLVICIVFMLAHVLEPAEFIEPDSNHIDDEWAILQVKTTVDFAPKNAFLNWYIGGLNYQVIHHLFPYVCHIHYPQIAGIVGEVCEEFGIKYNVYPTFTEALIANYRWLKLMGNA